ncbi:hypothetical protein B296_00014293 [Ensete ventricosum]|uniref:Uncharacterized protein n=1 Tax=Ensete ventricosum TaxID=4639 RepID=A0A426XJT0_ENSVE|nr:hypothetical protein B296_00014293 [Ensete ventricosum]
MEKTIQSQRRPYLSKTYSKLGDSKFITRESVCNGDVTRRRHGVADHGGIIRGNTMQAIVSREGQDHRRWVFVCASELALDESLSHWHMGAVYHRGISPSASTSESHGRGRDHMNDQELLGAPLR